MSTDIAYSNSGDNSSPIVKWLESGFLASRKHPLRSANDVPGCGKDLMDWTHLHLALNHIPVLGIPFLLGLLIWSRVRCQRATLRFCLWLFVMLAVASIAIKFTGDFAAEKVATMPGFDEALIEHHEESADQATTGVFFMGIAAALALLLSRGGRTAPKWSLRILAVLAVGTFALMVRTSNSGGHIRHPEIRPAAVQSP